MKMDSIREVKNYFLNPASVFSVGVAVPERAFPRSIALGLSTNGRLAVRCYGKRQRSFQEMFVSLISKFAKNEVEVQYLPMIRAFGGEKLVNQGRCRPIKTGWSCGHAKVTAGSVGYLVQLDGDKKNTFILSNCHVIANCGDAKKNDPIVQPGIYDKGSVPNDTVAKLHSFIKINPKHNKVDAAIALLEKGIDFDMTIDGFGKYAGTYGKDLVPGQTVRKLGRTTGNTSGVVSAIQMDNVAVQYGSKLGVCSFDNQIEIHGEGADFSAGGDSGSGVLNPDNQGVGLLFAGGGTGETHRTYANDLRDVLKALKIKTIK